jgi:hypothetical protein
VGAYFGKVERSQLMRKQKKKRITNQINNTEKGHGITKGERRK